MKNKLLLIMLTLGLSSNAFAAADDNEIWLQQSGTALTLNITQKGYGNKVGGDDFSGSSIDMILTGATNSLTLLQYGDANKLYGPFIADLSTVNLSFVCKFFLKTGVVRERLTVMRNHGQLPKVCRVELFGWECAR